MKRGNQANYIAWRFYFVIAIIALIICGLVLRLIDLTVIKKNFLRDQGDARAVRIEKIPAFRGMITDRRGVPLAISTSVYSVWVNPKEFELNNANVKKLSAQVNLTPAHVQSLIKVSQNKKREFVYIKRSLSPEVADKIKRLALRGVYLQQDYKRFYPDADISAHVIGFTDVDDKGKEGLELEYDAWLAGTQGKKLVVKDRLGRIISDIKTLQEQKVGNNLQLSIDNRIQYVAYRELAEGVLENKAQSGSVVVLDVKTGEVLAMVNQPSFNPNNRERVNPESFRNRAVTDIFEPGSTIKAFSIASALDSGMYKPDSVIDTSPGWMRVGNNLVRDEHNNGRLTLKQILQISSNVGDTKMVLSLPPAQLWSLLHRVGFGESTGIGFPGERGGLLPYRKVWSPFALATLSFGYGISVTALQLAHAYATIANDGIKIPLSLVKLEKQPVGERVIDKKVSEQMLQLLQSVVEAKNDASLKTELPTGIKARVPGYHVSGKTGTARLLGPNGYEKNHHLSSFVGIAPATNPRIVVAVVIRDPQGKQYYGGLVSAPVFEKIMESTLRILNIPPDDVKSMTTT